MRSRNSPDVTVHVRVLELLSAGEIEILGLLPYASNATLLTRVRKGEQEALAVYKPRRGERPLWDFPSGTLCLREAAAWVLDQSLGWGLVPPTVLREGPAGFGVMQLFVDEDVEVDVRTLLQTHPEDLKRIALFDVVINNADRKAGHLVVDTNGKLWSVDHGICFAVEPKLRTVIWAFEGERVPAALLDSLGKLVEDGKWIEELAPLLDGEEIDSLRSRIDLMLRNGCYPVPDPGGRHVPWPPW
ncbi:MAG: SCO1664 family protein [Actinomycetota bacterium]